MDDMLIVRMSDRSRERFARRRRTAPIGANFGLVMGLPLAIAFASMLEGNPPIFMALGAAGGLAIGGLLGRFMTPKRRPSLRAKTRH